MRYKDKIMNSLIFSMLFLLIISCFSFSERYNTYVMTISPTQCEYIKWVEFNIPYAALDKALKCDIKAYQNGKKIDWIELLAYLATKYGGKWTKYKSSDMEKLVKQLNDNTTIEQLTKDNKYYSYYKEAYTAVLGGFVGEFEKEVSDGEGGKKLEKRYGLKVYSPVAEGFGYSHYKDFGDSRSYGYSRPHLGNDLMGSIGTPIVAMEAGIVDALGWNQYGGWRIGIRSIDGKRYYYYAHLRKDRPYSAGLELGQTIKSGQVIGYLGMTGYSTKENVNNMTKPHLHFGMQLIFNECQKEGNNQIWIDVYNILELLKQNQSTVLRDPETKEYTRKYDIFYQ